MMRQVGTLLSLSEEVTKKKNSKTQALHFKCCSDCLEQLTGSVEQLLKTNHNRGKQFRVKSDSFHEPEPSPGTQTARFFNQALASVSPIKKDVVSQTNSSGSPSRSSGGPQAFNSNRRAMKLQHASSFGVIAYQSQTLLSDITLSMGADDRLSHAVKQHNLNQVSGLQEFMIELNKLKLNETLTLGVVENFLSKLYELDMDENLEYDLALEQLVKIVSVNTHTPSLEEDMIELDDLGQKENLPDLFGSGVIKATRGTIIQKVMRSRVEIANTAINNILLMSLPITSPYRAFDKQQGLESHLRLDGGFGAGTDLRETVLLPQMGNMVPKSTTNNTSSVHSIIDIEEGLGRDSGMMGIQPNQRVLGSNFQEIGGLGGTMIAGGMNPNLLQLKSQKPKVSFGQSMYISLDSFSFVKKQFTQYVVDQVQKYQVELIFSTETLPAALFEQLKKKNVLAVFPISQAEMRLLSMVLNTSIIEDVSLLTKDIEREYLGNIRKYYMVNVEDSENRYQSSLIFLDQTSTATIEPTRSLGITIYYEKADVSENLSNFLKSQLTYLYYSLTEHELMFKERDQTRPTNPTVHLNWEEVGDFRTSLSSVKHNIRNQLNGNNPDRAVFERTEIVVHLLDDENVYPDFDDYSNQIEKFYQKICSLEGIKNVHDIRTKVEESLESPKEYENFNYLFNTDSDVFCGLNVTKGDALYVTQLAKTEVILPYSEQDTTIVRFLKRYFKKLQREETGEQNLHQTEIGYYIADACVRMKVSNFLNLNTKNKFKKMATDEKKEALYLKGLFFNRFFAKMTHLGSTRSSMASRNSNNANELLRANPSVFTVHGGKLPSHPGGEKINKSDLTMSKDIMNTLASQNATIRCYVVCDTCYSILSDPISMEGLWKNMSFGLFLYNFAVARPTQSLFNVGKNLRQMQNTQLFGEAALQDDYCPHTKQSRAFHLGRNVIQFTRYPLLVHRFIHFSNRDMLLGLDPLLLEVKRAYMNHQRQYQDKIAVELSEYFTKQITLLVYVIKDYLARASKHSQLLSAIILPKRKLSSNLQAAAIKQYTIAEMQSKLTFLLIQLVELVSKVIMINHFCTKRQQLYKTNPLLRSVHNHIKQYSVLLTELSETVSPEKVELAQRAPSALKFVEVISKICKMNLELLQEQTPTEKNIPEEGKPVRETRLVSRLVSNLGMNPERPTALQSNLNQQTSTQVSGFGLRPTVQTNFHHFPTTVHRPDGTFRRANSEMLPSDEVSEAELWENPAPTRTKEEIELSKFDSAEPQSPLPMLQRAFSVKQELQNRRMTPGRFRVHFKFLYLQSPRSQTSKSRHMH